MLSKLTLSSFHMLEEGALWDNLELPEGYNKEILVNEILRQGAEFSLLYPDYEFMKYQIGVWSHKFYHNFERWIAAYNFDYEALYNVDVTTTTTDDALNTDNELRNHTNNRSGNSGGQNQANNSRSKAAYDATTLQPVEGGSNSLSTSESFSDSESGSESNSHSWEHSQTITEVKQGNYGTTMSQELLIAEYNAWRINIYQMIAELFVSEFCICIYQ